ncbi:hypothetical protein [Nitrosophilus alvini]|uniref:hypothetical protein n=1 Tax=Nitrosophilus alvini TaxID=2714855 RepID=UPI00190974F8|nr:hypothetical protein [Nitrosophilus alvini]
MEFYNPDNLFFISLVIFIFGVTVVFIYSKNIYISFFIASIKTTFFFIYFYLFFDGTFTLLDDWSYLKQTEDIINQNKTLFTLIFNPNDLVNFFSTKHIVYQLYNVAAFNVFGNNYFSPVALNIILTYFISWILYNFLLLLKFSKKISLLIAVFYLIHWDTLFWSSIINIKDFLAQFLFLVILYNLIKIENKKKIVPLIYIFISVVILTFLRFYLPYLIFISYLLYKIFIKLKTIKNFNLKVVGFFLFFSIPFLLIAAIINFFPHYWNLFMSFFSNPIIGTVRFLLTPMPFNLEESYQFLYFSSILHWMFFPFLLYGYWIFRRINTQIFYLISFVLLIVIVFYGSFSELQGPRHRIQITPYLILFESIGFLALFYKEKFYRTLFCIK